MSEDPNKKLPPLTTMAKNLGKSVVRNAKTSFATIEEEEQEIRNSICTSDVCGKYREEDHRCADCGCFLAEKIPLLAEYCPLGLWPGDEFKMPKGETNGQEQEQEESQED